MDPMIDARAEGRLAGARPDGHAGECPYLHDRNPLRQTWFAGFSEGRIGLRKLSAPDKDR